MTLNNPASAAKRAASQLREALIKIRNANYELGRRDLDACPESGNREDGSRLRAELTRFHLPMR